MPTRTRSDETLDPTDFEQKANDLDFDVWGSEGDDEARRRDPLRRRSTAPAPSEDDEELA